MNKILNSKYIKEVGIYISIFFAFYLVLKPVIPYYGDDTIYQSILSNKTYFNWVSELYLVWSGRIVLTSLLVAFLNIPLIFWKLSNAFFFTLLVYSIVKTIKLNSLFAFTVMLLLLYLPINILNSSSFWITGSINYLWPISSLMYLIYVLKEFYDTKNITNYQFIFSIVFALLASNNEQSALVLVVLYSIIIILSFIETKRINSRIVIIYFIILIGFLILMLAPGNYNRLNTEIIGIMPSFGMLTIYDKLMFGINFTSQILFYEFKYYLLALTLIVNLLSFKLNRKSFLFSLIPLTIVSFKIIFDVYLRFNPYCTICNDIHYILFNFKYFSVHNFYEWIHLIPTIILFIYVLSILISTIQIIQNIKDTIFYVLIYLASLSSSIILGFSPTIEASGNRIYLLMVVLLITFSCFLFSQIKVIKNNLIINIFTIFVIVLITYSVFGYMNMTEFIVLY